MLYDEMSQLDKDAFWRKLNNLTSDVSQYVPGALGWIAAQKGENGEHKGWGFVIGKGFAFVTDEEVQRGGDDLVFRCAQQILGFPVDSLPDIDRRITEAKEHIKRYQEDRDRAIKLLNYWERALVFLDEARAEKVMEG